MILLHSRVTKLDNSQPAQASSLRKAGLPSQELPCAVAGPTGRLLYAAPAWRARGQGTVGWLGQGSSRAHRINGSINNSVTMTWLMKLGLLQDLIQLIALSTASNCGRGSRKFPVQCRKKETGWAGGSHKRSTLNFSVKQVSI